LKGYWRELEMLIIDKNNDFYDHYSHIYGVDKQIVFDRRGSTILTDGLFHVDISTNYNRHFNSCRTMYLLEVGYVQYLIELINIKITEGKYPTIVSSVKIDYDIILFKTFDEQKHLFEKEMTLAKIHVPFDYRFLRTKKDRVKDIALQEIKVLENHFYPLPILKDTKLTKVLDAEAIWKALNVYISSQKNDKKIDIINSDKAKLLNHGFDEKLSFRHPIR
jgi:hypothetical protein